MRPLGPGEGVIPRGLWRVPTCPCWYERLSGRSGTGPRLSRAVLSCALHWCTPPPCPPPRAVARLAHPHPASRSGLGLPWLGAWCQLHDCPQPAGLVPAPCAGLPPPPATQCQEPEGGSPAFQTQAPSGSVFISSRPWPRVADRGQMCILRATVPRVIGPR